MRKNLLENRGIPKFMEIPRGFYAHPDANVDSWYVISNFESDGEIVGFQWHFQTVLTPMGKAYSLEFLLMNGTQNFCVPKESTGPVSESNGANADKLDVYCDWGHFRGDIDGTIELKTAMDDNAIDVTLTPRKDVLFNGVTGLFPIYGSDSHEIALPNMAIEGSITINGKEYHVGDGATAWFDRQWSTHVAEKDNFAPPKGSDFYHLSWLWLGLALGENSEDAVSFWDEYESRGRFCFATFMKSDGTHSVFPAQVEYEQLWTSEKSGNTYPHKVTISVPEEDFKVVIEALITNAEYVHEDMNFNGCHVLSTVKGTYHGQPVDKFVLLEMVNDVCGELQVL